MLANKKLLSKFRIGKILQESWHTKAWTLILWMNYLINVWFLLQSKMLLGMQMNPSPIEKKRGLHSLPWWCVGGCSEGCVARGASSSAQASSSVGVGGTSWFQHTIHTQMLEGLWGTDHSWRAAPHTYTVTLTNTIKSNGWAAEQAKPVYVC